MSTATIEKEIFDDVSNPLDSVEEIMLANDWIFDRMTEDELTVQVSGKMGEYRLFFNWQEEYSAMQFCCEYDFDIKRSSMDEAAKTMTSINSTLWLGHFDFREGTDVPCFRHTTLFRGLTQTSGAEHLEDLVDIAIAECERFHTVFDLIARGNSDPAQMELALMPAAGQS